MGKNEVIVRQSLTLGAVLAIVTSWSVNQSVLWAIVHAIFGWLYVVYYMIFH